MKERKNGKRKWKKKEWREKNEKNLKGEKWEKEINSGSQDFWSGREKIDKNGGRGKSRRRERKEEGRR